MFWMLKNPVRSSPKSSVHTPATGLQTRTGLWTSVTLTGSTAPSRSGPVVTLLTTGATQDPAGGLQSSFQQIVSVGLRNFFQASGSLVSMYLVRLPASGLPAAQLLAARSAFGHPAPFPAAAQVSPQLTGYLLVVVPAVIAIGTSLGWWPPPANAPLHFPTSLLSTRGGCARRRFGPATALAKGTGCHRQRQWRRERDAGQHSHRSCLWHGRA
jgi:hypothetical protein